MDKYIEKNIREDYHNLVNLLIEKNISITTMESATSGQIASLITDTEDSSKIFKGAYITYSNEAKVELGVPLEVIIKHSVYSKETAIKMATIAKDKMKADIGIGITGTMGNVDPNNPDSSTPGKVFFAIAYKEVEAFEVNIAPQPSRLMYKLAVAKEIYDVIIKMI